MSQGMTNKNRNVIKKKPNWWNNLSAAARISVTGTGNLNKQNWKYHL